MECTIVSEGLELAGHLVAPAPGRAAPPGLVLCHGFPSGPAGASAASTTYPQLAQELSEATGWAVLTFSFRGAGASPGNFSLRGWLRDLGAAVARLRSEPVSGVWLAGSSAGGAVALCLAARDRAIRGVATLAAPATFASWAANPRRFLERAREVEAVRDRDFPADFGAWARELRDIRPLDVVHALAPRPLLLLQGSDDDVVAPADAQALLERAGPTAVLRMLDGADHRLRHDPRAIALLGGWMVRQADG